MIKVAPAILEESMSVVKERIQSVSGLVPFVQVDICDGKFVPSTTIGAAADEAEFATIGQLAREVKLGIELDMMVELGNDAANWLAAIAACKPSAVVLHYGSVQDGSWADIVKALKEMGVVVGLGVHIGTPLSDAIDLVHRYNFSYIQVMGIERVGYGGQEFSDKALEIIKELRKAQPDLRVSVDGGVNLNTVESIKREGVQQLAAGSAIFNVENKREVIRLMQA